VTTKRRKPTQAQLNQAKKEGNNPKKLDNEREDYKFQKENELKKNRKKEMDI
jgi:hypothetical protein